MKKLFWVSAFVFLSGCNTYGDFYYVDERFTQEEEQSIQAAADMWEEATYGALHVNLVFGQRVDVQEKQKNAIVKTGSRAAYNRFPEWQGHSAIAYHHTADTLTSDLIVVFSDKMEAGMLKAAVAHEMGHAFGLGHSEDENALMYWNLNGNGNKCVTRNDLEKAHELANFGKDKACDE